MCGLKIGLQSGVVQMVDAKIVGGNVVGWNCGTRTYVVDKW